MGGNGQPANTSHPAASLAIEARGLTVVYGATPALRGIDLSVGWGERLAVFGPNGAGKTTLLRALSTLVRPTAGQLWLAGRSLAREPQTIRRLIGVVGHQTYLYPELTVGENLRYYGRLYQVPDLAERIASLLERVGLYHRRDEAAGTLSRGLMQRLAIARAVLHDPPILLLDEPETGLDAQAFQLLESLLLGEAARPRTVVLTTHQLELGLRLSERAVVLVAGRLVHDQPSRAAHGPRFTDVYRRLTVAPA